jgi:signal transduction histidine kinase
LGTLWWLVDGLLAALVALPAAPTLRYTPEFTIRASQSLDGLPVNSVTAIARDIPDRRRAEARQDSLELQLREAQKLEAVGRLAGGVAPDFNDLLQIIRGFTDMLRQDAAMNASAREENLAEVSRAAGRASDLTRQLPAFSRREAVEMRRCQLGRCVEEALRLLRPLVGTHIRIEAETPGTMPWVLADTGQLGQVLLNLAAHARDARPDGGTIRLGLRETEIDFDGAEAPQWALPGRGIELTFADTGAGIVLGRLSRIFEPFLTTKERGKGTGLGLAAVSGIIQQHRGRIKVKSTVGLGTTFRIVLPASQNPTRSG